MAQLPRRKAWRDTRQWRLWLQGLFGSRYDGLHHFSIVAPGVLMRSGQPHVRDLEQILREHGLKTIVVARGGTRHPLRGRWFRLETQFAREHGIRLEHMPFTDHSAPPAGIFDRFLSIVRDPANQPVLVHCEQGWHRTGILCAAYRVACESWTVEKASEELWQRGFEYDVPKRRPLYDAFCAWAARLSEHAGDNVHNL